MKPCISFTPETALPQLCKRSIVEGISTFLNQASCMVYPGQKLVLAGCFSGSSQGAWLVQATEVSLIPETPPQYQSNAEEADARIWRHAKQSTTNVILIYSPDTTTLDWACYIYVHPSNSSFS